MPEEYFVELSQFKEDNPGVTIKQEDIVKEEIDGKIIEGINVRTGRKGYFKRTQAVDKTVNRNVELYSREMEVSEDAASSWHSAALKQTMPTHREALEISDLPLWHFFTKPSPAVQHQPQKSLTDVQAPTTVSDQVKDELLEAVKEESDEDKDDGTAQHRSLDQSLMFALPAAKAEAATKAAAKAAARAQAKSHAKEKKAKQEGTEKEKQKKERLQRFQKFLRHLVLLRAPH